MKKLLCVVIISFTMPLFGQITLVRHALEKIEKKQWTESKILLKKGWRKDSVSAALQYAYAKLFFNPGYLEFNVDSAHHFAKATVAAYSSLTQRDRQRLKKIPLDSAILTRLLHALDSAAFEKAKSINTEDGYARFIARYSAASQIKQAIELRDEAAFVKALEEDKYEALHLFLEKYPGSHRAAEAKLRYEKLLFEYKTRGKTLAEYKKFVSDFPASPHTPEAIQQIFILETESGEPQAFERFIRFYPNTPESKRASAILFHLLSPHQQTEMLHDSLKNIYPLREWIPFHQEHGWGFLDESGNVMLTGLPELHEQYFCEPLKHDFIITTESLIGRTGATISTSSFTEVTDIGGGFLLAKNAQKTVLLHKSGWLPTLPVIRNATLINNRYLALQQEKLWALFTLTGKQLTPFLFDALDVNGQFLLLSRAGKKQLIGFNSLLAFAQGTHEPVVADEIKRYGSQYFWMRNGALEQVLDENLNVIIPFGRQSIQYNSLGLVIVQNNFSILYNWPSLHNTKLARVSVAEPWLITQPSGEKPSLYFIPTRQAIAHEVDSIWFDQSLAAVRNQDSIRLWQSGNRSISMPTMENYKLKLSRDSVLFVLITGKSKTTVYEAASMKKIFSSSFEFEPILKNFFLYEHKGKQGLLDSKGKTILPADFDAVLYTHGIFSLLKNKQFGSYNPQSKKLIKPAFDSNLKSFGKNWLITSKKGSWGFLNLEGKPHTPFEFESIEFWNDSLAIVKKSGKMAVYSIANKRAKIDAISSLERGGEDIPFGIFRKQGLYGLLSESGQELLPAEFEELIWQEVNQSVMFIGLKPAEQDKRQVLYFSSSGKLLKSVLTSKEAAYQLLCD